MERTVADRRRSLFGWLAVGVYATFLVVAAFEHHDLLCHVRCPQHCVACASSQPGPAPRASTVAPACSLADAGRAVIVQPVISGVLLVVRSSGRSPPPAANS